MDWKFDCKVKVFLSSTFKDLIEERGAVEAIIHRMAEHYIGMEHWGSFNAAPLDQSVEMVRTSDVLLLALGDRYGFVPPGESRVHHRTRIPGSAGSPNPRAALLSG